MTRLLPLLLTLACVSHFEKPTGFNEDPSSIIQRLSECERRQVNESGVLESTVWKEDERVRVEQLFLRSLDGRLRVDTLSPVGQPLNTIAFDGGRILILDHQNHVFRVGPAERSVLREHLFVDLEPVELSALIGGCVPFVSGRAQKLDWDSNSGRSILKLEETGRTITLALENNKRVRSVDIVTDSKHTRLLMGDYRGTDFERPFRFKFIDDARSIHVEFTLSELKTMATLPSESFLISPPNGVRVEPL